MNVNLTWQHGIYLNLDNNNLYNEVPGIDLNKSKSPKSFSRILDNHSFDTKKEKVAPSFRGSKEIEPLKGQTILEFNQFYLIYGRVLPDSLKKIVLRFNGLCELICNYILLNNLLGKDEDKNFLKKKLTIKVLSQEKILKSHLIDVYSIFHKIMAFLFGVYPDNIFSICDQWKLVKKDHLGEFVVNESVLFNGLEKVKADTTLKLEVFARNYFSFIGHSLLIKKVAENSYIFFDPDSGEHRGLSQKDLARRINEQLSFGGTDIYFLEGDSFIKKLNENNVIEKF